MDSATCRAKRSNNCGASALKCSPALEPSRVGEVMQADDGLNARR